VAALLAELDNSDIEAGFLVRALANTGDFEPIVCEFIDTVASKFDAMRSEELFGRPIFCLSRGL
jgi:hypothetical protein